MASSSKYALAFALTGVACCALAWQSASRLGVGLAVAAAASLFGISLAYLLRAPGLLGKRSDGVLGVANSAALLPYFLLNHVAFSWACRVERAAPWQEIVPGLLLGRRLRAAEAARLPAGSVVDLTSEFAETRALRTRRYSTVPMLDGVAPSLDQLTRAVEATSEAMARGATYVHCALGHGRSATVVIAYLMESGQVCSADEGLALVRQARPAVRLSRGQRRLLEAWQATRES